VRWLSVHIWYVGRGTLAQPALTPEVTLRVLEGMSGPRSPPDTGAPLELELELKGPALGVEVQAKGAIGV